MPAQSNDDSTSAAANQPQQQAPTAPAAEVNLFAENVPPNTPIPLPREVIIPLNAALAAYRGAAINRSTAPSPLDLCIICLEAYGSIREIRSTRCGHNFHATCLGPWLASYPFCPLCRRRL